MKILILNGTHPGQDPHYRGTERAHPTYCEQLSHEHELNKLFRWFLDEGGELGVAHDLPKARRLTDLCNIHFADRHFELLEVTDGWTTARIGGQFLGFELSAGYNSSLVGMGALEPRPNSGKISQSIWVLSQVVARFFRAQLNGFGLFQEFDDASLCLQSITALQGFCVDLYESNLSDFEVVGVYVIPEAADDLICGGNGSTIGSE